MCGVKVSKLVSKLRARLAGRARKARREGVLSFEFWVLSYGLGMRNEAESFELRVSGFELERGLGRFWVMSSGFWVGFMN